MALFKDFSFYKGTVERYNLITILTAAIYAVVYDYIIREYLFVEWEYMLRYDYHNMDASIYSLYIIICIIPLFFYKGFKEIASIISIFSYIFVYVPFMNTLFVAGFPSEMSIVYVVFFLIAQILFFKTDTMHYGRQLLKGNKTISFKTFEIFCILSFLFTVLTNLSKLHFVNIFTNDGSSMMYDLRVENGVNSYLCDWLKNVFIPILIVCYLKMGNYKKFALAFSAMVVIFMLDMQKITFIMPFIITALFYVYKTYPRGYMNYFHIYMLVALMIIPLSVIMVNSEIYQSIAAILIMRTQCVGGRQFAAYFDCFEVQNNPYTYFSHISFVNNLTGAYPYNVPIGYVVSQTDANSNANYFLMDGIAGAGIFGCVLVAMLFIVFKSYINSVGDHIDKGLCSIILLYSLSMLMNVSLFTALLTGGFIVFFLVCKYVDLSILNNNQ